ncbi:large ribosomal subunit protein eL13 [Halyomorpha halys]|uniref:large ribosomal subunit protein eL13 n=1 Tax=Halyomorpha halys TaxID=286706 RepID=UPI0006D51B7F|nr:60S ribosomal protein L13 [Halyomorpha halys]
MAIKANNMIPSGHFHKDWQRFIKTWFQQTGKKTRRRVTRNRKAARKAPKPVKLLRPAVRCPSIRYNTRLRPGRGFTLDEIRRAGLNAKFAKTIGIAVDFRRRNKSVEAMLINVQRLKEYMSKLILFPTKRCKKLKKGEAVESERKLASQVVVPIPVKQTLPKLKARVITDDELNFKCYAALRSAWAEAKFIGIKMKKLKEASEIEMPPSEKMKKRKRRH